jgi:hypothetical protein
MDATQFVLNSITLKAKGQFGRCLGHFRGGSDVKADHGAGWIAAVRLASAVVSHGSHLMPRNGSYLVISSLTGLLRAV